MKRLQINVSNKDYEIIKTYSRKSGKTISNVVTEIINFHKDGFDGFKTMKSDFKSKERTLIGEVQSQKSQVELLAGIIKARMKPSDESQLTGLEVMSLGFPFKKEFLEDIAEAEKDLVKGIWDKSVKPKDINVVAEAIKDIEVNYEEVQTLDDEQQK